MSGNFQYVTSYRPDGANEMNRVIQSTDGNLYMMSWDSYDIYRVNPSTGSVLASFSLTTYHSGSFFARDPAHAYDSTNNYWYITFHDGGTGNNSIMIFNLTTMSVVTTKDWSVIGAGLSPARDGLRLDVPNNLLYAVSDGSQSSKLHKITASTLTQVTSINVQSGGVTYTTGNALAIDLTNQFLYVGYQRQSGQSNDDPAVVKVNLATFTVVTPVNIGFNNSATPSTTNSIDQLFLDSTAANVYSVSGRNLFVVKIRTSDMTNLGHYNSAQDSNINSEEGSGLGPDGFIYTAAEDANNANKQCHVYKFDITGSLPVLSDTVDLPNRSTGPVGQQWGFFPSGMAFNTSNKCIYIVCAEPSFNISSSNYATLGRIQYDVTSPPPLPPVAGTPPGKLHARVGEVVSLPGSGFTGATGITFNGTSAITFSVINDTTISVVVPVGATSGPIVVTGPGGSATVARMTITPNTPAGQSGVVQP